MDTIREVIEDYYKEQKKSIKDTTIYNYISNLKRLGSSISDFKKPEVIINKINSYSTYMKKSIAYNSIFIGLFKTKLIDNKELEGKYADAFRNLKVANSLVVGNIKTEKEEKGMKATLNDIETKVKDLYQEHLLQKIKLYYLIY